MARTLHKKSGTASRPSLAISKQRSGILRSARGKALALIAAAILLVGAAAAITFATGTGAPSAAQEEYQKQLQSQVESGDGAPLSGRDPASQPQNSLQSAASKPIGTESNIQTPDDGSTPAAGVNTDHSGHTGHTPVPGSSANEAQESGVSSGGCLIDYGKAGEQCLQYPGSRDKITCEYVRTKFKDGIAATGTDRFNLDRNKDKIACGKGD
ncbi:hypothetical protein JNJ66_04140 [Candidatus Saccharibacteria bacterium]|nr:hypothetical protein [Candidatus Saccharibacteria bacterium]